MTTFVSIDQDALGGNAPGYAYGSDDVEVTVEFDVTVHSATADAIISEYEMSRLINKGRILSDGGLAVNFGGADGYILNYLDAVIRGFHSGIWIGGSSADPASAKIVNHGDVIGQTGSGVHFAFGSGGNELVNYHLIAGAHAGVQGSARAGSTIIENYWRIESDQFGISISSGSADVVNTIYNAPGARIKGAEDAIAIPSGGQISLKNKGKIVGGIDCDAIDRNDKVVNKKTIKGDIELGSGNDKFVFGGGKQGKVFGEADADTFIFRGKLAPAKHAAKIGDFTPGEDTIVLSKGLFKGLGEKGALKGKLFHAGKKAADENDRVLYDEDSGKLRVDEDGRGGADARLIAKLDDGLALRAGDFLVTA
jgi:hypothetical protein